MGCVCLNKNAHPEPTRGCGECCGMCCGYTTPAIIGFLIAGLVISSDVYSIILIARNPHSAWRIIVCLIALLLTTFFGVVVNWAYYQIIFTPPGYVPRETWRHPPTYAGPPPATSPREQSQVQVHFPPGYNSGSSPTAAGQLDGTSTQQPQQQQQQQLAPTMARRSPNHSGDLSQPPTYPQRSPVLTAQVGPSANPLRSAEDGDTAKSAGEAGVEVPVAAVVYSDNSGDSGNGRHGRPQHGTAEDRRTSPTNVQSMETEQLAKPTNGAAAGVRTDSHSPYATPNCASSLAPAAAAGTRQASGTAPLNPYTVTQRNANGSLRFCHKCRIYKPDGAHHCSVCQRCVFNFDHHCPFVNNCVGRNNYKLFVVFVLYGGVGSFVSGGLMAVTLFAVDRDEIMSKIGWVAVPAVDVILGLSLLLFYVQHQCLLSRGESTLDSIAHGDDTFQGWRASLSKPRRTPAEKAEARRQKQLKVERHQRTLLGNESPWWRRFLPFPVRTDDTAEDTVPGNV